MDKLKRYDLHKDDYTKLHFELNDAQAYVKKNEKYATIPHKHSFFQVIWFTTAGQHYVDYEVVNHPENSIFFINQNQVHHFCSEVPNKGWLFHFNDIFINTDYSGNLDRYLLTLFNEIGPRFVELDKNQIDTFKHSTDYIQKELDNKALNYRSQVYHIFHTLLTEIERIKLKDEPTDVFENADYTLAVAFKKLLYNTLENFYSIDYYSNELNSNKKRLTEVCKRYLNDTPSHILKATKLLEAKRRLSNKNLSIAEIGYELGFKDPTYFTKYFKKGVGVTPKVFRQQYF